MIIKQKRVLTDWFLVPYVYEKPPVKVLKDYVADIKKQIQENKKEKKEKKEKKMKQENEEKDGIKDEKKSKGKFCLLFDVFFVIIC